MATGVSKSKKMFRQRALTGGVMVVLGVLLMTGRSAVQAAAPPAGTVIGNQAAATYTDADGQQRQATSNIAITTVQQVAGLLLDQTQTKLVTPGGQVVFPHTLTNTGNGTDTFALVVANLGSDNFDLSNVRIYPDADGNGVPDSFTDLTSSGPTIPGVPFTFVVVGNVPGGATSGQTGQLQITATSGFLGSVTTNNVDTAQISNQAVIGVTKDSSLSAGNPGVTNTYQLSYVNTGNNTATNLVLLDTIPTGLTYLAGSGRWSVSGSTPLTDAAGGDPAGLDYQYDNGTRRVSATIATVAAGGAGYLTFQVTVNTNQGPGVINNVAGFGYGDGGGTVVTNQQSNIVGFDVNPIAGVVMGPTNIIAAASQGAVLVYTNSVQNTGNGTDTFEITVASNTFPTGTSYQLFQNDGNTPMVDSDSDGVPDTGPLGVNASYNVILKVTLPPNATGGPFALQKKATSRVNPAVSATEVDVLTAITLSAVDLSNNSPTGAGVPGAGAGPEATAVVTNTVTPGPIPVPTTFTLYVNNTGPVADTFQLSYTNALPAGWTVQFTDAANTPITSTSLIAAGGNQQVKAVVTVPANALAGPQEWFFQALSATTGAKDIVHDRVDVAAVHAISITPLPGQDVTSPGTVTYVHQVCNNGNTNETIALSLTEPGSGTGWSSLLYLDVNSNGVLDDPPDVQTSSINLAPGQCTNVFVKVTAPAGLPVGTTDTTTITGATAGNTATASQNDQTTVVASNVTITKEQGIDANCDGSAVTYASTPVAAPPGACIRYRITVANNGTAPVTNVHVFDATPAFTVHKVIGSFPSISAGTIDQQPADGAAGSFDFNVGPLAPNTSAVIELEVRINQ